MNTNQYAALFAAAFAVQQAVEIVDSILTPAFNWDNPEKARWKKAVLKLIALGMATVLTVGAWDTLSGLAGNIPPFIWASASVLAISAGTDGVNSVLKYMTYSKEQKKGTASQARDNAKPQSLAATARA